MGFTGRYLDQETGLYYFRTRYYSGSLGRFIQRDWYSDKSSQEFNNVNLIVSKDLRHDNNNQFGSGYQDGMSLYMAYLIPNGLDPTGLFLFTNCDCRINPFYENLISLIPCDAKFYQRTNTSNLNQIFKFPGPLQGNLSLGLLSPTVCVKLHGDILDNICCRIRRCEMEVEIGCASGKMELRVIGVTKECSLSPF